MNHRFQVWSPQQNDIKVLIQTGKREQAIPMQQDEKGYWTCSTEIDGESLYQFQIGKKKPVADPCSHFQPRGILGPSMVVQHEAYDWQVLNFQPVDLEAGLIYEAHVGTFTEQGSFSSAIEKISYLAALGITHLELMPVCCFSGQHGWGYDGVFPFAPHQAYGNPSDLKTLIDACHAQGIAVIMDVVYNHFGPSGNVFGEFGPYHTDRYHTPWGQAINFDDAHSDAVREMVLNNVSMWLIDYKIDGLRLDAIHAIYDKSATHILEEISRHVKNLNHMLNKKHILIAESDLNDPKIIRDLEHFGYGYDAQWSDDFHHAIHSFITQEREGYYQDFGAFSQIAKVLKQGFLYDGKFSPSRQRRHGRSLEGLGPRKLITYIQNHDQIGNRAIGDRIHHKTDLELVKVASCLHLLAPSVPMIFQGEEWACSSPFIYFTAHEDSKLANAVREGRVREFTDFGWNPADIPDPQSLQSFQDSKLNWNEQDLEPHKSYLDFYRELIAIRKDYLRSLPDIWPESDQIQFDEKAQTMMLCYPQIIIAANFSDQSTYIEEWLKDYEIRILSKTNPKIMLRDKQVLLPARSAAILHKES